jgi:hypothetical protein
VRQQRQHPRAGRPRLTGAHLGQQILDQVVIDAGVCSLGWFGDGHPQLPPGHRRHQVAILDRAGQLRVVGAPGLEIGAHPQHGQRRRWLIRPVPGAGGRVQRGDERPPLPLLGALGEQLLELVDHQQQPALRQGLAALAAPSSPSPAGGGGRASAACRAGSANLAGSASSPRRTADASVPASSATRSASSSSGALVGVNTTHGHHAAPGATASPSARTCGSTPARSSDDLPAPDTPDTTKSPVPARPRDIRSSTCAVAASRPKKNAASRSPNALSPR